MNILVLHALGNPALAPRLLLEHVFFLRNYFPQHNYIFHDAALPVPDYVRQTRFDAILLDVTFLGYRWRAPSVFSKFLADYAFVAESEAVKLAFPQDEYDCHRLLDDWMYDWRIDVVFSVISSGWDVLYPRYSAVGKIVLGYTGYIDERLLGWKPKKFSERRIDIGYRARRLPPNYGRLGQIKYSIGVDLARVAAGAGLVVDIKLGEDSMLFGDSWLHFLDDSKFTLGANSGSSLLDPRGEIREAVNAYIARHPSSSFEEVEANCFPGVDIHNFTAISPRVLEASLLGSAQILVEGSYSEILTPYDHFIPIKPDASNFSEVLSCMRDVSAVEGMIARCRDAVLSVGALRYRSRAEMIFELIDEVRDRRGGGDHVDHWELVARYDRDMASRYRRHWVKQSIRRKALLLLRRFPRVYQFLRSLRYGF